MPWTQAAMMAPDDQHNEDKAGGTRRRRPPVEGVPSPRPRCPLCNRPLKFWTSSAEAARVLYADEARPTSATLTFKGWRSYGGLFDRLQCALEFAVASHRAGYRIKPEARP